MYAILCATSEELAALQRRLEDLEGPEVHGPTRIWRGRSGGAEIVLASAGIGKVNAAAAATVLMTLFEPRALIFCGVAGGLSPDLPVGAVLLADRIAIHDFGVMSEGQLTATASGKIPLGAPPLTELFPVSPKVARDLAQLAERLAPGADGPVRLGGVVTADYFLNCTETREALHARFGADAIDMESGAVHQVAEAWGADLYVIRTLSDLAGSESHITFKEMVEMAAHNSAMCVPMLLEILEAR
jgi:adenosylhomocysteine nucleosidase